MVMKKERLGFPLIIAGILLAFMGVFYCYKCETDPCIPIDLYCFIWYIVPGAAMIGIGDFLVLRKAK